MGIKSTLSFNHANMQYTIEGLLLFKLQICYQSILFFLFFLCANILTELMKILVIHSHPNHTEDPHHVDLFYMSCILKIYTPHVYIYYESTNWPQ